MTNPIMRLNRLYQPDHGYIRSLLPWKNLKPRFMLLHRSYGLLHKQQSILLPQTREEVLRPLPNEIPPQVANAD
jgi:hypothetical protein